LDERGSLPDAREDKSPGDTDVPHTQMRSRARRRMRRLRYLWFVLKVVAVLLALVLIGPLLLPLRGAPGTVAPEQLAWPASRWVEIDGLSLHYEVYGLGHPVMLLLHGFGASTFSWREVVEPLGEAGTVVAFDRPGFGLSARPMPGEWSGTNPYGDQTYAALTVSLMDELGLAQAVLVGHSAGATVAVLTALTYPERVSGLVLVAPALGSGREELGGVLNVVGASPHMRRIGPRLIRLLLGRLESLLEMSYYNPAAVTAEVREGYKRPLRAHNWDRALWEIVLAPKVGGLDGRLGELAGLPVLFVTGDSDAVVPAEVTELLAQRTAGAELVVIPECGHLPQEEHPATFAAAVLGFIERVRRATGGRQ